ncbi:hypothetical protein M0804_010289 [Polistes exclamans]|nr:hypothetical protein M0804_010289 [Polistes exclamans]
MIVDDDDDDNDDDDDGACGQRRGNSSSSSGKCATEKNLLYRHAQKMKANDHKSFSERCKSKDASGTIFGAINPELNTLFFLLCPQPHKRKM